jgi:hypothetical protein
MAHNTSYTCYVCLETKTKESFVKPCKTLNCSGLVCPCCLQQQYISNKTTCGICRQPIIRNVNQVFNTGRCCISFAKLMYTLFLLIVGSTSLILLALGKSINPWIDCYTKVSPCDDGGIGAVFLTIPFILLFFQLPCCCKYNIFCCLKNKPKYKSYITMGILFLVSCLLIVLAHGIGYPIVKHMYGMDVFFTWRTFMAGFTVYAIIFGIFIFGLIIFCISCCIYDCTKKEFTETKINYGTLADIPQNTESIIDIDSDHTLLIQ